MQIRDERPTDVAAIRAVTTAAFKDAPHSDGTEAWIVDGLRTAGVLTLSLVAAENEDVLGHVAFSPVLIDGADIGWLGLGPLSVRPDRQGRGIGGALVRAGLERLSAMDAAGCVVFGEPSYYGRFGFAADPGLVYADAPPGYFQRIVLRGGSVSGEATYHGAFAVSGPP